jgi:N-succinyldiaminopimelate aminotransferase
LAGRVAGLPGSVYSNVVSMLASYEGETYPLHIGDTWLEPPLGCRVEDQLAAEHPGLNRYTQVPGIPELRSALREHVAGLTGHPVAPEAVFVGTGGTGCLAALAGAMVGPGSQVLVLAPAWPLFAGMVPAFGGEAVHVPFIGVVDAPEQVAEVLDAHATEATVALYLNTPNNPTGRCIPRPVMEAIATWARRRGVWIVSDEVYDQMVYTGTHTWMRELAPERTASVCSFSKAYGMAGYRCGFMVGPPELMVGARKVSTYTYYCAPRPSQLAALRALQTGQDWIASTRETYAQLGREAATRLGVAAPEGSTFLFLDVADHLDESGLEGFLRRSVSQGLLVAPGEVFGPYPTHIRVCFTSVAPDRVRRGLDVLAGLIGR